VTTEAVVAPPRHARLRALSSHALVMYDALRSAAYTSGYVPVAAAREAADIRGAAFVLAELAHSGLVLRDADGLPLAVTDPETLDQADALAAGVAP
jgi:hypothetical protein